MSRTEPVTDPGDRRALVERRIGYLRGLVSDSGSAGVLLETRRDVAWATAGGALFVVAGSDVAVAPLLVTADGEAVVIAPINEAGRLADEELDGLPIEVVTVPWEDASAIEAETTRRAGRTYERMLTGAPLAAAIAGERMRLAPLEHARMRWLGAEVTAALDEAATVAAPGATESAVASAAASVLLAGGSRVPVLLAAADERLRYRHPLPGTAAIRGRLMVVVVAERWGLHAAGTRMLSASPGAPDGAAAFEAADAAVRRVLEAMAAASRPGATLGEVMGVAQAAYAAEGMPDEWRNHHQGGTIGYGPRERIATPGDLTVLEAGMAVAWNPSVPGGKAEATYLIGADGLEPVAG